ncbi:High affinity nitrate transporter 2.5 [Symbiodinium microadriaticum]|uniref:High affinity nitrate transporter 2.5 n=1 Tax=Symbiodinium microadriaticum TaxID=2951 RepID=A0A1Q9CBB7_SYMMI|nr:High affinity nitrate transporter 2.5 [Symbiodinium microadriaticum]
MAVLAGITESTGCAGATFVTNQFWCSLMFVVGTANATAAGWGNLGGGVTQIFMMSVLFNPMVASGMEPNVAWRVSMVVPAVMFVLCAICMKLMCWDMPTARNYDPTVTGKTQKPSMWDYVEVLRDVRVVVMIFQYSACFGTELAMNNQLATHFRTYFQMDAGDASALAGAFGLMNLFARSLGGISSDICYKYFGFRGRISDRFGIWAQFLALFFEAIFLFSFGKVDNSQPWYVALAVLVCFSLFVQMAEGTSYGIVPFMNRKQLAVVSALVGAGGNLGAVTLGGNGANWGLLMRIAGFCFYKPIQDALLPFQVHAGYVMFWALLSPCYYWSEFGGMFVGPAQSFEKAKGLQDQSVCFRLNTKPLALCDYEYFDCSSQFCVAARCFSMECNPPASSDGPRRLADNCAPDLSLLHTRQANDLALPSNMENLHPCTVTMRYKDNGVLILVDSGDRRVEVEIGSGLNVAFKRDGWLRGMIDTGILPSLRHGSYDEGVLAGVTSCCQKLLETDREVSSPVRFRNRARLLWGSSGVSAWLAAMLLLGRTFARPPKCSRCGGRMSRLREAEDAELQDGQKAEKAVGSAQHVLCVCKRPGCKASWAKAGAVRRLSGDRRLGGALERTSELKLTGQEVKEAAKTDAAVGILAADRRASRYRTCPACGYRTQLSRSFRNPVTGVSFKETECFFCNAYTCVEVQPVVTLSGGSTTGSTTNAAFLPDAQVVATLGAAAAAMVAEKAETSEGEEHSFNADCDGSGRLLTPLLHDVKEAMELEGTVPEKHRLQHCGQDLTSTSVTGRAPRGSPLQVQVRRVTRFLGQTWATGRLNNWKEVERCTAFHSLDTLALLQLPGPQYDSIGAQTALDAFARSSRWRQALLVVCRHRLHTDVAQQTTLESCQRAGHWSPLRRGSSVWGGAKEQALLQRFDDVLAAGRADTPFLVVPPNNEQQLSTLTRSALQRWQKAAFKAKVKEFTRRISAKLVVADKDYESAPGPAAAKQAAAIKAAEAKRNAAKKAAERAAEAKRIAAHKAAERAAEVKRIAAQKAEKAAEVQRIAAQKAPEKVSNQGALPSKTGKSPGLVRYIDSGPAAGWHVKGRAYPTAITMWVLPPNGSVWLSRVQALKELEESDPKVIEAIDRVRWQVQQELKGRPVPVAQPVTEGGTRKKLRLSWSEESHRSCSSSSSSVRVLS